MSDEQSKRPDVNTPDPPTIPRGEGTAPSGAAEAEDGKAVFAGAAAVLPQGAGHTHVIGEDASQGRLPVSRTLDDEASSARVGDANAPPLAIAPAPLRAAEAPRRAPRGGISPGIILGGIGLVVVAAAVTFYVVSNRGDSEATADSKPRATHSNASSTAPKATSQSGPSPTTNPAPDNPTPPTPPPVTTAPSPTPETPTTPKPNGSTAPTSSAPSIVPPWVPGIPSNIPGLPSTFPVIPSEFPPLPHP